MKAALPLITEPYRVPFHPPCDPLAIPPMVLWSKWKFCNNQKFPMVHVGIPGAIIGVFFTVSSVITGSDSAVILTNVCTM